MPHSADRRLFLSTGLAAVGGFLLAPGRRGLAHALQDMGSAPALPPIPQGAPIVPLRGLGESTEFGGLPFSTQWHGDSFRDQRLPFHSPESPPRWPQLDEHVEVVVIGGGISGLATAYELGERSWVLFDLRTRMGGVAQGERWSQLAYSLGSAYFMVPDEGSFEDRLYGQLGVYDTATIDRGGGFRLEYEGAILDEVCNGCSPRDAAAIRAYGAAVQYYASIAYPDIPWTDRETGDLVRSLDVDNFHASVKAACGGFVPDLLAKAVQAYCYSSFGVGWDELSAAAGWNFIAAEEFGRIVMPGGNAGLATLFWQHLRARGNLPSGRPRLRAGCIVTDIRPVTEGVALSWRASDGRSRTIGAKRVVYAGPKHVFGHMMPGLQQSDPDKLDAMHTVRTTPYVVANVLLNAKVREEFYDLFFINNARFPMDGAAFEFDSRITDCVAGTFAVASKHPSSDVLTLYWPLPWHTARFTLVTDDALADYCTRAAPQITFMLQTLGLSARDVAQVRMTRWGHAMTYATPGTYNSQLCQTLRRPTASDRIWFASQDSWSLPAVETCLAEARWVAQQV